MALRWKTMLVGMGALAALVMAAAPARAQDMPIPGTYPEPTSDRARPTKPANEIAVETAAADAAQAACAAGRRSIPHSSPAATR